MLRTTNRPRRSGQRLFQTVRAAYESHMRAIWLSVFLLGCGPSATMMDAGASDASVTFDASFDAGTDAGSADAGTYALEDAGSLIGTECTDSNQCGGAMFSCYPFGNGNAQYCVALCNPAAVWVSNGRLERAACPARAVCLPDFNSPSTGQCMAECLVDSDCQSDAGYFCRNTFVVNGTPVQTTTNGYCAPAHCRSRGCPSAYQCFC